MNRFLQRHLWFVLLLLSFYKGYGQAGQENSLKRPNILFCIADDASIQHMSAYGYGLTKWVNTPGFDQIAKEGLLFTRAYTPNAKCAPSRSAVLTGRNPWQLEAAGNHNPVYPAKFTTFMEAFTKNGYHVGFTGKGWAPGNPGMVNGNPRLLTGPRYNNLQTRAAVKGISEVDYTANFEAFLKENTTNKPFCFWFGSQEPHRAYEYGSGITKGQKKISDIESVPPFWIDNETVRNDMLDYAFEVEYFDNQLIKMLKVLETNGELENTIIVVTSDNGMPFPRVKGHVYEHDNHLPLAIMWKAGIVSPGRVIDDFVSFIDFAPTFFEAAAIDPLSANMQPFQGKSMIPIITSKSGTQIVPENDHVLLGRERQDVGRPQDEGYPVRAIVEGNYFYSINYEPNRWPSGNPETGYLDTDGSPTKTQILSANRKGEYQNLWQLSFGKKGSEELYQINKDPYSMKNLADDPEFAKIKDRLKKRMEQELRDQVDPRMMNNGKVFDNYPYGEPKVIKFYERYINGEKIPTPWVNPSDYEKRDFKP